MLQTTWCIKTSIGYIVEVKRKGSYHVGMKAHAKTWKTKTGAEKAEEVIRKVHGGFLSQEALVVEEWFNNDH